MTCMEFWGATVHLGLALATALTVFLLLRGPVRLLLAMNSRLIHTQPFFLRSLMLMLLLVALAESAGVTFTLPEDAAFMEYVWQAAGTLNGVFGWMVAIIAGFTLALAVLIIGLGRFRDE